MDDRASTGRSRPAPSRGRRQDYRLCGCSQQVSPWPWSKYLPLRRVPSVALVVTINLIPMLVRNARPDDDAVLAHLLTDFNTGV